MNRTESNSASFSATRRTFLGQATLAAFAAGVSVSRQAWAQADGGESNRTEGKPVIYAAIKGGSIGGDYAAMVARLKQLKQLGYDGVEGASPGIPNTGDLRKAIDETEFPVHGVVDMVHWQDRLSSPDPAIREKGRIALEQSLHDSHAIGGSSVLLVPGRVSGAEENHDHVWHRSIVEIRKVLPVASRLGIHILIENVWNGFCEDPQQFRDYLDEIDSPWVGAYFDIGNCRKFGPAEDWIRTLGSRIVKLDIKDWGVKNSFCRLGEGDVNWPAVRKALLEIGYSGWATREGSDKSLEDTIELTRQLLG